MQHENRGPSMTESLQSSLYHVGRWTHEGRLRQMYQPVLKRWAFLAYQVRSPQRDLADDGVCVWQGGDLWGTQDAAERAVAEAIGA